MQGEREKQHGLRDQGGLQTVSIMLSSRQNLGQKDDAWNGPCPQPSGKTDIPLHPRVKGRGKPLDQASPCTGCCAGTAHEHPTSLAPAHAGPHGTPQINPSATAAPGTYLPMFYSGRRGQIAVGDFMLPYLLFLRANLVNQGAWIYLPRLPLRSLKPLRYYLNSPGYFKEVRMKNRSQADSARRGARGALLGT